MCSVRMHVHLMYVHRFIVRDFEYDPKAVKAERETKKRLQDELKKQFVSNAVLRTYVLLSLFHLYSTHGTVYYFN